MVPFWDKKGKGLPCPSGKGTLEASGETVGSLGNMGRCECCHVQMVRKDQCPEFGTFTPGQPFPATHVWCRYFICLLPVPTRGLFVSVGLEAFPYIFRPTIKWFSWTLSALPFISHCMNLGKLLTSMSISAPIHGRQTIRVPNSLGCYKDETR